MNLSLNGRLIECVCNPSKDKTKLYYSLNVYSNGQLARIGVPEVIYNSYVGQEGKEVTIPNISLWCEGKSSLFIKE